MSKLAHSNQATMDQIEARAISDEKSGEPLDPRDPDHSREGIFVLHNCSRCSDGRRPCVVGNPSRCEYPHARND